MNRFKSIALKTVLSSMLCVQQSMAISADFTGEGLREFLTLDQAKIDADLKAILTRRAPSIKSHRDPATLLETIRRTIGHHSAGVPDDISKLAFSNYKGRDGATQVMLDGTPDEVRAAIVKQVLEQLGYQASRANPWVLTNGHSKIKRGDIQEAALVVRSSKQFNPHKEIEISTVGNPILEQAYGKGTILTTLGEVFQMATATEIYCDGQLMPADTLQDIYNRNSSQDSPTHPRDSIASSGIVIKSKVFMPAWPQEVPGMPKIGLTSLATFTDYDKRIALTAIAPEIDIYSIVAPFIGSERKIWSTKNIVALMFLSLFKTLVLNGVEEFYANSVGLGAYIREIHSENPVLAAYTAYISFYALIWAAETVRQWAKSKNLPFPRVYYATFGRDSALTERTKTNPFGLVSGQPSFPEIFDFVREQFLGISPDLPVYRFDYDIVSSANYRKLQLPGMNVGLVNAGNQSCQEWAADLGSGYRQRTCGAAEEYLGAHCFFALYNRLIERIATFGLLNPKTGTELLPAEQLPWNRITALDGALNIPLSYRLNVPVRQALAEIPVDDAPARFIARPDGRPERAVLMAARAVRARARSGSQTSPRGPRRAPAEPRVQPTSELRASVPFAPFSIHPSVEVKTPGKLWGIWKNIVALKDSLLQENAPGQLFIKEFSKVTPEGPMPLVVAPGLRISQEAVTQIAQSRLAVEFRPLTEGKYSTRSVNRIILMQRTCCLVQTPSPEESRNLWKLKLGTIEEKDLFTIATISPITGGNDEQAQDCHLKMLKNLMTLAFSSGARTLVLFPLGVGGSKVEVTGPNGMASLICQAIAWARHNGMEFSNIYINPCDGARTVGAHRKAFVEALKEHEIINCVLGDFDTILLSDQLTQAGERVFTIQTTNSGVVGEPETMMDVAKAEPFASIGRTCAMTTAGAISVGFKPVSAEALLQRPIPAH